MKYKSSVVRGAGRGERMQLPTINFAIPKDFPYPYGIYAGYLSVNEKRYVTAFHYGPIPTFDSPNPSLEAFVLSGRVETTMPMDFELIKYLREVQKFSNSSTLRAQITKDIRATEGVFTNK